MLNRFHFHTYSRSWRVSPGMSHGSTSTNFRLARKTAAHLLWVLVLIVFVTVVSAQSVEVPPQPEGRVSDYKGTLIPSELKELENELSEFERKTTNQIAVLLIPTLSGDSPGHFL